MKQLGATRKACEDDLEQRHSKFQKVEAGEVRAQMGNLENASRFAHCPLCTAGCKMLIGYLFHTYAVVK